MSKELEKARELVAMLEERERKNKVRLDEIPVGGKFDTGIGRFIVLEQEGDKTAVTTEGLYRKDVRFGDDSNEYFTSELSDLFEEEIFPEFKEEFGSDNLCSRQVSLATVDMQRKDLVLHAKVRPLTFDEAFLFPSEIILPLSIVTLLKVSFGSIIPVIITNGVYTSVSFPSNDTFCFSLFL